MNLPNEYIYSGAIAYPKLYVSYLDWATSSGSGGILQYDLETGLAMAPTAIFAEQAIGFLQGQLEIAPDGDIWTSHLYNGPDSLLMVKYKKYLSVIKYAHTDSATYLHNYFYAGDSAKTSSGLPHFPNYNLGPEGVFLATAGKDTVLCNNTNPTGVAIGAPPVPNVTYSWQPSTGLSATSLAQPLANPTQSTWYYLTATDTTATSCAVNTDSVYVEVRTCVGVNDVPLPQAKLYPNPTTGTVTVELPSAIGGMFTLFNLLGQRVSEASLTSKSTVLDIDSAPGIYLYQISMDGHLQNGKLLVE